MELEERKRELRSTLGVWKEETCTHVERVDSINMIGFETALERLCSLSGAGVRDHSRGVFNEGQRAGKCGCALRNSGQVGVNVSWIVLSSKAGGPVGAFSGGPSC